MKKIVAGVLLSLVISGPALAKRDEDKGCSKRDWRVVIEREDKFRLCLFAKD